MLSFKQYVTESNKPVEQGRMVNGVPCAVVNWRRNGSIGPDGVPAALITKPERKPVREKAGEPAHPEHVGGHYGDKEDWDEKYDNGHIGHGFEVHDHLVKADKTVGTDEEHVANYTGDSSTLNRHLYNRHVDGEKHADKVGVFDVKAMDKAIGRNKLKHDLHTYSGVTWHPGDLAKQHPDRHVHLPAFTSTSLDKSVAHTFATGDEKNQQHVIHFHLKKGQPAKYAEHLSRNPGEHEVILPRNTTVKIHPKADRYYDHISDTETHVWHAHVVDNKA